MAEEIARQLILQSPTVQNAQDVEQRRAFVRRQLTTTQGNIQRAETSLAEKQTALGREASTRGVLDLQDEIKALELKIEGWQKTYAALLGSVEGKSPASLTVVEPAFVPSGPVGPSAQANVLMAAAVGGLLAIGTVLLIECVINGNRLSSAPTSRASSTSRTWARSALRPGGLWAPSA